MEAYTVEEPGGNFHKTNLPRPTLKPNQVLIRIKASGVNPLDTKIRAGKAAHTKQPLPAVLGLDMAGIVEEVGPDVTAFKTGDEVYGMVGGVGGLQGTLAEYIAAGADLLVRKPKNLSMRQAAALPLVVITAWEGLVDRAKVCADHTVLVHAGAGGVGHVAIQLARAYGARVFATVSAEKKQIVEDFGATPVDYRSSSVEEYVAQMSRRRHPQAFEQAVDALLESASNPRAQISKAPQDGASSARCLAVAVSVFCWDKSVIKADAITRWTRNQNSCKCNAHMSDSGHG